MLYKIQEKIKRAAERKSITLKRILFILIFLSITLSSSIVLCDMLAARRRQMVEGQIENRGVTDRNVIKAMMKVKRHLFVPKNLIDAAYRDTPLPIGHGQTISQPYIVAYMTEAAGLKLTDRVLEIGTGSGYQAAILGEIVKEVYTIEIVKPLAESAGSRLKQLGYDNIKVKWGDGYKGWPEYAPFDAIIVTAAPPEIPEGLVTQLKTGGKMVIPVGSFFQELYLITRTESGYEKKALMPVRFVPMVHGD
jgi:protein-L-isoaspartate(D-aspartate) O-methyltransferase